jgi:hypothetical protein
MAQRAHAHVVEINNGSHVSFISHAAIAASLIESAARTVR